MRRLAAKRATRPEPEKCWTRRTNARILVRARFENSHIAVVDETLKEDME